MFTWNCLLLKQTIFPSRSILSVQTGGRSPGSHHIAFHLRTYNWRWRRSNLGLLMGQICASPLSCCPGNHREWPYTMWDYWFIHGQNAPLTTSRVEEFSTFTNPSSSSRHWPRSPKWENIPSLWKQKVACSWIGPLSHQSQPSNHVKRKLVAAQIYSIEKNRTGETEAPQIQGGIILNYIPHNVLCT